MKAPQIIGYVDTLLKEKILSSNIKLFCKKCQESFDEMLSFRNNISVCSYGKHDWTFSIYNPDTDFVCKEGEKVIFICSNCFNVSSQFIFYKDLSASNSDGCKKDSDGKHKYHLLAKFYKKVYFPNDLNNIFTCKRCKLSIKTYRKPKSNYCKSGKPHEWELDPNQKNYLYDGN